LARALAGELSAGFVRVPVGSLYGYGAAQANHVLVELFALARRSAPCVMFFDELDALGQKRADLKFNPWRPLANALQEELDGVAEENAGVFFLGATNHPWDLDSAIRRPGRFDRMLLVLPPDAKAREVILRTNLEERPIAGIDLRALVKRTEGYSGADLVHLCKSGAENALVRSAETGEVSPITMNDLTVALGEMKPSTTSWFEEARNVVLFANEGGTYDDLRTYMTRRKLL
jgi:SpoVK/Ycf46/Vps4 family AAA+-type ATPase